MSTFGKYCNINLIITCKGNTPEPKKNSMMYTNFDNNFLPWLRFQVGSSIQQ